MFNLPYFLISWLRHLIKLYVNRLFDSAFGFKICPVKLSFKFNGYPFFLGFSTDHSSNWHLSGIDSFNYKSKHSCLNFICLKDEKLNCS